MNLFLLAWNLPHEKVGVALDELRNMTQIYPTLDPSTIWSFGQGSRVFAASIHNAKGAIFPRVYDKKSKNQVVLYDGCLVDRTGNFDAHNAESLSSHWDDLSKVLEGQFVTARLNIDPPCMEIMNDFLGVYQTYYVRHGSSWLISNNVRLLSQISNIRDFDPLGVSLYIGLGWAGSDRTLRHGIRVMPGGQRWTWKRDDREPSRETHFKRVQLAQNRQRKLSKPYVERLAGELIQLCKSLAQSFGPLEAPLTAGRDSRVMLSLLIRGGITARYFTKQNHPETADVKIGTQIAKRFSLPHHVDAASSHTVIQEWENASRRVVERNDGMVSLAHIDNSIKLPSKIVILPVHLYGAGGEIAKAVYESPFFFLHTHSVKYVEQYLTTYWGQRRGVLARPEAITLTRSYLRGFVKEAVDEGFSPLDVPALFYAYERTRRWAGANFRQVMPHKDVFSPFCTRAFVGAAFSIPAIRRYAHHVHYQLLSSLAPELHSFPFEKTWPPQEPIINFCRFLYHICYHTVGHKIKQQRLTEARKSRAKLRNSPRIYHRALWLEAKNTYLRELCLDQADSSLWDFVDRSKFERITSIRTDPSERRQHLQELFDVATLFQYALS